jgi:[phosphatase 2A protein]-leucine-carboxy methyltransferase
LNSGFGPLATEEFSTDVKKWGYYNNPQAMSTGYFFHGVDLRQMPAQIPGIRADMPTLVISECCLCYLTKAQSDNVIAFFTSQIPTVGVVMYEPTKPNDAFGKVMTENLARRNISMPSTQAYPSLEHQISRLHKLGFDMFQEGASVSWLWDNWVSHEEKERLARLEMFDEEEEWRLLGEHYLVLWAAREGRGDDGAFKGWDERSLRGELEEKIRKTGKFQYLEV